MRPTLKMALLVGSVTMALAVPAYAAASQQSVTITFSGSLSSILQQIAAGLSQLLHHTGTSGGSGPQGAPGPVLGAGLPFAAVAGGYAWLRRRRARKAAALPAIEG